MIQPVALSYQRLESSELAKRRELETIATQANAKMRALWYLDEKFRPRYWAKGEK